MKNLVISLLIAAILLIPLPVSAANNIEVIRSETGIHFPDALVFQVEARSSNDISRIRLQYTVDKISHAPVFAEAWPDFQPAKNVSARWIWDMRLGGLPPGARVTYWWIIEDSAGNKLTTDQKVVTFDDTRYSWRKVSDSNISIYWYSGSQSFAQEILNSAVDALNRQSKDTGAYLDKPVSFYIYANYQDLRGSLVTVEDWAGGVAYAGYNIISIGISTNNLDWGKKAVAHELGHLVTHQITYSPYGANLPPWLDEGLAMHAEGEQDDAERHALVEAIEDNSLSSLRSLSSPFSAYSQGANFAYAKSQSVVEYLINSFGKDKMRTLLVKMHDGATMDDAMLSIYGFDLDGLDQNWTDYMLTLPKPAIDVSSIYPVKWLNQTPGLLISSPALRYKNT